jgi:hypothetical protein
VGDSLVEGDMEKIMEELANLVPVEGQDMGIQAFDILGKQMALSIVVM